MYESYTAYKYKVDVFNLFTNLSILLKYKDYYEYGERLEKWRYSYNKYRFIVKITFMPFISFLCSARVQPPKAILKLQGDVGNTFT